MLAPAVIRKVRRLTGMAVSPMNSDAPPWGLATVMRSLLDCYTIVRIRARGRRAARVGREFKRGMSCWRNARDCDFLAPETPRLATVEGMHALRGAGNA